MTSQPILILASSSPYRRELLERLQLRFRSRAPRCDEAAMSGEAPPARAMRLARNKALSLGKTPTRPWVLGSDQVCALGQRILHKPGDATAQIEQLSQLAGREVHFHTAIALAEGSSIRYSRLVDTTVRFRKLSANEIEDYCRREPASDCAGGFKVEALGICLFEWVRSDDPTALIGLPLIACAEMLRHAGLWSLLRQPGR